MTRCLDCGGGGPLKSRSLCGRCYQARRRKKLAMPPKKQMSFSEGIARIDRSDPGLCWDWPGARYVSGYGRVNVDGKISLVHRVSYELFVGSIPDGLVIDHLCRNRLCCNPVHLEPVTIGENLRRSPRFPGNRTHCPHGHEYSTENTYIYKGGRFCRACKRKGGKL